MTHVMMPDSDSEDSGFGDDLAARLRCSIAVLRPSQFAKMLE